MHCFNLWSVLVYYVPQGGHFNSANTIYVWPTLCLTQERDGIPFPNGKTYHWLVNTSFLFWTIGAAW